MGGGVRSYGLGFMGSVAFRAKRGLVSEGLGSAWVGAKDPGDL